MKKLLILITAVGFQSCVQYQKIGTLTAASTRNVETTANYVELSRYVDSDKIRGRNYRNIADDNNPLETAINKAVASVTGGEFMRNVTVYVNGSDVRVIGDVWGLASVYNNTATAPATAPATATAPAAIPATATAPVNTDIPPADTTNITYEANEAIYFYHNKVWMDATFDRYMSNKTACRITIIENGRKQQYDGPLNFIRHKYSK